MTKLGFRLVVIGLFFSTVPCWASKPTPCWHGERTSDLLEYEDLSSHFEEINGGALIFPQNDKTNEIKKNDACVQLNAPRAQWRIIDNRLWLASLLRGNKNIGLGTVYGGNGEPIFAEWFSGELRIERGKILCRGFQSKDYLWDTTTSFQIEKGKIINTTEHRKKNHPMLPTKEEKRRLLLRSYSNKGLTDNEIEERVEKDDWAWCLTPAQQKELRGDPPYIPLNQDQDDAFDHFPYSPAQLWAGLMLVLKTPPAELTYREFRAIFGLEFGEDKIWLYSDKASGKYFQASKSGIENPRAFPFRVINLKQTPLDPSGNSVRRTMEFYFDLFGNVVGYRRMLEESEKYCIKPQRPEIESLNYRYIEHRLLESPLVDSNGNRRSAPYRDEVYVDDEQSMHEVYKTLKLEILPNGCLNRISLDTLF